MPRTKPKQTVIVRRRRRRRELLRKLHEQAATSQAQEATETKAS